MKQLELELGLGLQPLELAPKELTINQAVRDLLVQTGESIKKTHIQLHALQTESAFNNDGDFNKCKAKIKGVLTQLLDHNKKDPQFGHHPNNKQALALIDKIVDEITADIQRASPKHPITLTDTVMPFDQLEKQVDDTTQAYLNLELKKSYESKKTALRLDERYHDLENSNEPLAKRISDIQAVIDELTKTTNSNNEVDNDLLATIAKNILDWGSREIEQQHPALQAYRETLLAAGNPFQGTLQRITEEQLSIRKNSLEKLEEKLAKLEDEIIKLNGELPENRKKFQDLQARLKVQQVNEAHNFKGLHEKYEELVEEITSYEANAKSIIDSADIRLNPREIIKGYNEQIRALLKAQAVPNNMGEIKLTQALTDILSSHKQPIDQLDQNITAVILDLQKDLTEGSKKHCTSFLVDLNNYIKELETVASGHDSNQTIRNQLTLAIEMRDTLTHNLNNVEEQLSQRQETIKTTYKAISEKLSDANKTHIEIGKNIIAHRTPPASTGFFARFFNRNLVEAEAKERAEIAAKAKAEAEPTPSSRHAEAKARAAKAAAEAESTSSSRFAAFYQKRL